MALGINCKLHSSIKCSGQPVSCITRDDSFLSLDGIPSISFFGGICPYFIVEKLIRDSQLKVKARSFQSASTLFCQLNGDCAAAVSRDPEVGEESRDDGSISLYILGRTWWPRSLFKSGLLLLMCIDSGFFQCTCRYILMIGRNSSAPAIYLGSYTNAPSSIHWLLRYQLHISENVST